MSADPLTPPQGKSLRFKLCIMMFLQIFIWGAWFELGFDYIPSLKFASWQNDLIFGAFNIGALVALFFSTQFADRNFAAEKFLGISHLIGGAAILGLFFLQVPVGTKPGEVSSVKIVAKGPTLTSGVGELPDKTRVLVENVVSTDKDDKTDWSPEEKAKLQAYVAATPKEREEKKLGEGFGPATKFWAVFHEEVQEYDAATEEERKEPERPAIQRHLPGFGIEARLGHRRRQGPAGLVLAVLPAHARTLRLLRTDDFDHQLDCVCESSRPRARVWPGACVGHHRLDRGELAVHLHSGGLVEGSQYGRSRLHPVAGKCPGHIQGGYRGLGGAALHLPGRGDRVVYSRGHQSHASAHAAKARRARRRRLRHNQGCKVAQTPLCRGSVFRDVHRRRRPPEFLLLDRVILEDGRSHPRELGSPRHEDRATRRDSDDVSSRLCPQEPRLANDDDCWRAGARRTVHGLCLLSRTVGSRGRQRGSRHLLCVLLRHRLYLRGRVLPEGRAQ